MNLFRPAGCSCGDLRGVLRAALEDKAAPPCSVHTAAVDLEAEARDAALERLIAEDRARTAAATPPPPSLREVVGSLLAGEVPADTGLAPVHALPLNANPSSYPSLAGMNTTTDNHQPFDAA